MHFVLLLLAFAQASPQNTSVPKKQEQAPQPSAVVQSARSVAAAETPDSRVVAKQAIAPGQPPILSFRFYEGKLHHRFGNADLLLDDAGH